MAFGFGEFNGGGQNDSISINYSEIPAQRTISFYARWTAADNTFDATESMAVISHMLSVGDLSFNFNPDGGILYLDHGTNQNPNPLTAQYFSGYQRSDWDIRNGLFFCIRFNDTDMFDPNKGYPKPKLWVNGVAIGDSGWLSDPTAGILPLSGGSNKWVIGKGRGRYGNTNKFKGLIAEVALYAGLRPDEDCRQLSLGKTALNFPVDKLKFYLPLETDAKEWVTDSLAAATVSGTLVKPHPTVIKPSSEPTRPAPPPQPNPANTRTIYSIGNSLSDTWRNVGEVAETKGKTTNYGRHMIPGAPLHYIAARPTEGFTESPYGYYATAFADYAFDAVSFQPFVGDLVGASGTGDVATIDNFITLISAKSRATRVFIYGQWPEKANPVPFTAAGWENEYMASNPAPGAGTRSSFRRTYYQELLAAVRTQSGSKLDKAIALAPAGDCLREFNRQAGLGQIPGYTSAWDLYADGIHLNGVGSYLVSCCMFTCFFGVDPRGATVPASFGTIAPTLRDKIHDIVWNILKANPDTFVASPVTLRSAVQRYKAFLRQRLKRGFQA
jgi:hypothetical protein